MPSQTKPNDPKLKSDELHIVAKSDELHVVAKSDELHAVAKKSSGEPVARSPRDRRMVSQFTTSFCFGYTSKGFVNFTELIHI